MRKASALVWILAAATGLAAVPVAAASAPRSPAPIHHRAARRGDPVDPARAATLRARARELTKDRAHFRRAAELFEEASALTPVEDGDRAQDLYLAANLDYFTGALVTAQADMARSADAALERGDVAAAADALVDAAMLAAKRHQPLDARAYALRALHLAASPLLSPELRDRIRQRVIVTPVAEKAWVVEAKPRARTGFSVAAQRAKAAGRVARRAVRAEPAPAPGR